MLETEYEFDCKARIATLEDVDAIIAFYEQHRTPAVYLRNRIELENSIKNELFVIVENNNKKIIAGAGIYLLNDGKELEECIIENGLPQRGVVAELGSVLRWKDGLPKEKQFEGVWHPFLFSVPMILLFHRMWKKNGLAVDTLVCDVQTDLITNKQRLMGQVLLTPLRWQLVKPGADLLAAFENTVRSDDPFVARPKEFFCGFVANLPKVASYLMLVAERGLTNREEDVVTIDMTNLIQQWTTGLDSEGRRYTILGKLQANEQSVQTHGKLGWRDLARTFNQYAPLKGKAINGPYRVAVGADFIKNSEDLTVGAPNKGGASSSILATSDRPTALDGSHVVSAPQYA